MRISRKPTKTVLAILLERFPNGSRETRPLLENNKDCRRMLGVASPFRDLAHRMVANVLVPKLVRILRRVAFDDVAEAVGREHDVRFAPVRCIRFKPKIG